MQSRINPTKWQSRKKLRRTKSFKNVQSKTAATKHRTIVFYKLLTRNKPSPATMAHLTASDKAFIVSQHYAGKTAAQIQRKFKRDRKQTVALSTVSRWLNRVKTEFEESCTLQRTVNHNETIYKELGSMVLNFIHREDARLMLRVVIHPTLMTACLAN